MWPYYLALLAAVLFKVGGDVCLGRGPSGAVCSTPA